MHRSSAAPFLWDGYGYCCPFAFGRELALFSEIGSVSGYLPSFVQELIREGKYWSLAEKLGRQEGGRETELKKPNSAILIKVI